MFRSKSQKFSESVEMEMDIAVSGDVQVQFYEEGMKDRLIAQLWVNSNFVRVPGVVSLTKKELDYAIKDRECEYFDLFFTCQVEVCRPVETRVRSSMLLQFPEEEGKKETCPKGKNTTSASFVDLSELE